LVAVNVKLILRRIPGKYVVVSAFLVALITFGCHALSSLRIVLNLRKTPVFQLNQLRFKVHGPLGYSLTARSVDGVWPKGVGVGTDGVLDLQVCQKQRYCHRFLLLLLM
jgi:hypothetical protein